MRVELRNFTVRFGSVAVVDGVTATLEAGKIHGLLGRNGAGKTTLLSVISAFRRPNGGEVLINGQPPVRERGDRQRHLLHPRSPRRPG
jgi:ABC-2 type transport system ATP-binding protein